MYILFLTIDANMYIIEMKLSPSANACSLIIHRLQLKEPTEQVSLPHETASIIIKGGLNQPLIPLKKTEQRTKEKQVKSFEAMMRPSKLFLLDSSKAFFKKLCIFWGIPYQK